ncbi:branched-chain amino acid ABC transporter permease [Thermatribacter velox]|uniref:Branched-chain amino acid ABC transporter permease n=1 Tax=Thermatribacter velox TaxID=3039681 RepID=A0ABZ2YCW8_9BACT
MFFLQQLLNGIAQGSIYALMAIGYSIILGVVGLVSFVHGEVIMIGAFAGFYVLTFLYSNVLVALLAGFVATWALGMFIEKICYKPFRNAAREVALIATIGLSITLRSSAQIVFGTQQKFMPDMFGNRFFAVGDIRIAYTQVFVMLVVVALCIALRQLFFRTRFGIALRAVAMDKKAAALLGVNVNRTILFGNALACSLGGISGVLLGMYYNAVHPLMGATMAMKAFTSTVFGGLTSTTGAAIGGLLLGIFENLGVAFLSSGYRDIIAFLILIVVLLIKPSGLLGRKGVEL